MQFDFLNVEVIYRVIRAYVGTNLGDKGSIDRFLEEVIPSIEFYFLDFTSIDCHIYFANGISIEKRQVLSYTSLSPSIDV